MVIENKKTPIDFANELLAMWAKDFMESERYIEWGMDYGDAIAQVFQWNQGAEENIDFLKQIYNLLGIAINYLEPSEGETK